MGERFSRIPKPVLLKRELAVRIASTKQIPYDISMKIAVKKV